MHCRAQQTTYQAPSYRTAATELDVLERWSVVVPDTGALKEIQQIDDPKAATVSSAVLTGILRNPAGQQELKARRLVAMQQLRDQCRSCRATVLLADCSVWQCRSSNEPWPAHAAQAAIEHAITFDRCRCAPGTTWSPMRV